MSFPEDGFDSTTNVAVVSPFEPNPETPNTSRAYPLPDQATRLSRISDFILKVKRTDLSPSVANALDVSVYGPSSVCVGENDSVRVSLARSELPRVIDRYTSKGFLDPADETTVTHTLTEGTWSVEGEVNIGPKIQARGKSRFGFDTLKGMPPLTAVSGNSFTFDIPVECERVRYKLYSSRINLRLPTSVTFEGAETSFIDTHADQYRPAIWLDFGIKCIDCSTPSPSPTLAPTATPEVLCDEQEAKNCFQAATYNTPKINDSPPANDSCKTYSLTIDCSSIQTYYIMMYVVGSPSSVGFSPEICPYSMVELSPKSGPEIAEFLDGLSESEHEAYQTESLRDTQKRPILVKAEITSPGSGSSQPTMYGYCE